LLFVGILGLISPWHFLALPVVQVPYQTTLSEVQS
jgi:hypothetical protein